MVGKHHRLNKQEFEQTLGIVKDKEAWNAAVHEVAKSQTQTTTCCLVTKQQHVLAMQTKQMGKGYRMNIVKEVIIMAKHKI